MKAWVIKLGEKYACDMGDKYGCLNEAMLLSTKKEAQDLSFGKEKAISVEIKEIK